MTAENSKLSFAGKEWDRVLAVSCPSGMTISKPGFSTVLL